MGEVNGQETGQREDAQSSRLERREQAQSERELFALGKGQPETVTFLRQHFTGWVPRDTSVEREVPQGSTVK